MGDDIGIDEVDFELEPDTHRYLLGHKQVPSCTSMLSLARKPILGITWERLALIEQGKIPIGRVPRRLVQSVIHARKRGNAVHKAVLLYTRDDLDRRTLTREISCRLDLWRYFIDDYKVKPIPLRELPKWWPEPDTNLLCEIPLVHPEFLYGVTEDCGLFEVDGALAVVEIKATSTHNAATGLQLAAQQKAIDYYFGKSVGITEERYGVRLDPRNKRAEVKRYTDRADWSTFLSFMNVTNWRTLNKVGDAYA